MTEGLHHVPRFLDSAQVDHLVEAARAICAAAPLRQPTMPDGTPLKLKVTNAGPWGWWADRKGYRYVEKQPGTDRFWPSISPDLLALCDRALETVGLPTMRADNLLINYYDVVGSLGLHVDRTEDDRFAPIVSLSVGADAIFLMGGRERTDKTTPLILSSGDLLVQAGESRSCFHGIKKLLPTLTSPIKGGARLNFTFRKVKLP